MIEIVTVSESSREPVGELLCLDLVRARAVSNRSPAGAAGITDAGATSVVTRQVAIFESAGWMLEGLEQIDYIEVWIAGEDSCTGRVTNDEPRVLHGDLLE